MGKAEKGDYGKRISGRFGWTKREEGYRI